MATFENGQWVLVEFVGGPGDGRTVAIDGSTVAVLTRGLVDLITNAPDYLPIRAPGPGISIEGWADREQSAISSFDAGSPELYIQMVWSGDDDRSASRSGIGRGRGGTNADLGDDSPFLEMLLLGHEEGARAIVRRSIASGNSVTGLIESMVAPAMLAIGDGWASRRVTANDERRATAIVGRLLAENTPEPRHGSRGRAVVAALAGDLHSLPTAMAAAALAEDGWTVENLGAGVPAAQLLNGGSTMGDADLLILTVTMESNRRHSLETAARVKERGLPVLVGGPGRLVSDLRRAAQAAVPPKPQR